MPTLKHVTNVKTFFKIEGGLHKIGNQLPYFTITVSAKDFGGCCHDLILEHAPQFKKLVDMHLSNIEGVPMHAVENGWYWAGKTKYHTGDINILAKHFRTTLKEAEKIMKMKEKEELVAWVESKKPVWKAEAIEVIQKYNLEIF